MKEEEKMNVSEPNPKKTINELGQEVIDIFVKEKISPREALMVLREVETDAMLMLMVDAIKDKLQPSEDAGKV